MNEQKRILKNINVLFAQADIIEQAASVSLRRAEQVDQSILARAFRGELRLEKEVVTSRVTATMFST